MQKNLDAGWADMDFILHMKNTAYLDKAADARADVPVNPKRLPVEQFLRLQIGPAMKKDEVEYSGVAAGAHRRERDLAGLAEHGSCFEHTGTERVDVHKGRKCHALLPPAAIS